jgi:TetR/AcrR family transcriptional repressor of nem operon
MARPREFNAEDALRKAMNLFWERGYADTSLHDLLDVMGITRGSFYKAFDDKLSIYLATLDLYEREAVDCAVGRLTAGAPGTGATRIEQVFAGALQQAEDRMGCYLCVAAVDWAARGTPAEPKIAAMLDRLEAAFRTALAARSQPGTSADQDTLASFLLSQYLGLQVLHRANRANAHLTKLGTVIRSVVGS